MTSQPYHTGPIEGVSDEIMACIPQSGALHAYVWWASKSTHAPPWWHVGSGLAMIAHEAARHGYTVLDAQRDKPIIWSVLVGPSASGKSTAMLRAIDFYGSYLEAQNAPKHFVLAEGSIPGIIEKLAEGWDEETAQTLGVLHQEELSRLVDRKESVVEVLIQLADGRTIERHLVSARAAKRAGQTVNTVIKNACISGLFATTNSNLRRFTKPEHLDGGLYSRMLWFVGEPNIDRLELLPNPLKHERGTVMREWTDWAKWFLAEQALTTDRVVSVPTEVHWILENSLFAEAKTALKTDSRLNAMKMRGVKQAFVIAGLFALSQHRTTVLSEDMDAAVNLIEKCSDAMAALDPELATNETMQFANIAYQAIQRAGSAGLLRRDIYRRLGSSKRVIDEVIETLLDEDSIKQVVIPTGKRGRPPIRYAATGPARYTRAPEDEQEPPGENNVIPIRTDGAEKP